MKKLFQILSLALLFITASCQQPHNHHKSKHIKVKEYKVHSTIVDNNSSNDWLFYYLIFNNNGGCYYCSSPTSVTNFNTVSWTQSTTVPAEVQSATSTSVDGSAPSVAEQELEVDVESLSPEMETSINDNASDFGGLTESEMGDYEGGSDGGGSYSTTDDESGSNNSESSSESSSDSGSDSGGSDGGGDGGGGE